MAEQKAAQQQDDRKPGMIGRAVHAITKDGMLAAAFRQGASELAQALRAFPDSIHAEEPGTLLNPTQGEIADGRSLPSPSEIARDNQPYRPQQGHGQEHDHGHGRA